MVQIWGHRGLRGALPENTMFAFREAIRQGCDAIESDVHLTADNIVVLLHDPTLDRTTDGYGEIATMPYYNGVDKLRTKKKPRLEVPTFEQLIDLLLEPEYQHIKFNIDCKPTNDPDKLFYLMNHIIQRKDCPSLASRLIVAVWHQDFIAPARTYMPYAKLLHLGCSVSIARRHFMALDGFSLFYSAWRTKEGQALLRDCKEQNKMTVVWTINEIEECEEAFPWGMDAIITDNPAVLFVSRAAYSYDETSLRTKTGMATAFVRFCKHWKLNREFDSWQKELCGTSRQSSPGASASSNASESGESEQGGDHRKV